LLLRRDDQRLRRHAGLRGAGAALGSLGDCRLHSCASTQSRRDRRRCAGRSSRRSRPARTAGWRPGAGEQVTVETTYAPPVADIEAPRSRALVAGGIGLVACAIGFFVNRDQFFRSWLIAYLLFLGIALGSLAMVMIQHLSGGAWGVFRRIFEASSRTIPLLIVLFLPVLLGMT